MHHFFCVPEQIRDGEIFIQGPDVNHMRHVLRMKPGEQVSVYDGAYREYLCSLAAFEGDQARLKIEQVTEQKTELASRLVLFQGMPKGDKMDLIVQKAVELGAAEIVPVMMKRTVVKLDEKKRAAREKRWQAIAESAAKQSGRGRIPLVHPVLSFSEALSYAGELDRLLISYERAENMEQTRKLLGELRSGMSVGVFIGPEGGLEEQEVTAAQEAGAAPITLGRRILRTETAGLCALSILMFCLEE